MDYGIEVPSYRKVDSEKAKKKLSFEKGMLIMLLTIVSGTMISRVGFGFVEGLYLAPFGIAYLLALAKKNDIKNLSLIFIAVLVGYLSGGSKTIDVILCISLSTAVLISKIVFNTLNKEFKNGIVFLALTITSLAIGLLFGEQSFEINLIFL